MLIIEPEFSGYRWFNLENHSTQTGFVTVLAESAPRLNVPITDETLCFGYILPLGGQFFPHTCTPITPETLEHLKASLCYWPEQNELLLRLAQDGLLRFPDRKHLLLCESAFFNDLPPKATHYALPLEWSNQGIRRYGSDGLCHQWVWQQTSRRLFSPRRVVSVHLCDHPTVASVQDGLAIDTSQGFTPLEGIPSLHGSGYIDPSLVLDLAEQGMSPKSIRHMLVQESGWQAVANKIMSLVEIIEGEGESSQLVREMLESSLLKAIGAGMAALGGTDALVFACTPLSRWQPFIDQLCHKLSLAGLAPKENGSSDHSTNASLKNPPLQIFGLECSREIVFKDLAEQFSH